MKKLKNSFAAKLAAILLLCCMVLVCLSAAAGVAALDSYDYFTAGAATAKQEWTEEIGFSEMHRVSRTATDAPSNFQYSIYDENGKLIKSTRTGDKTRWEGEYSFSGYYSSGSFYEKGTPQQCMVRGYILSELKYNDGISFRLGFFDFLCSLGGEWLIAAAAISFLIGILLFIFLMCAAGHRKGELRPTFIEKIPFDLFTFVCICIWGIIFASADSVGDIRSTVLLFIITALLILGCGLLLLLWCMSLAIRVKLGALISGCICYKALALVWRGLRALLRLIKSGFSELPRLPRWLLIAALVLLLELMFASMTDFGALWVVEKLILLPVLIYLLLCMNRLRSGAEKIARGDENAVIDGSKMFGEFRAHAEDLNNIRSGLSRAVDERMKSERMRTELITNVSHDIKTPLTSIISYVDLLSKEEPENEKTREYVEVLTRQSAKLKKLIEDLIEASKASGGAITVELSECDLRVMVEQAVGEYSGRLSQAQLTPVVRMPEQPVFIAADGRLLWRVLDNLLGNICKYSLPGTRVYFELVNNCGCAELCLRNISRAELNISPDELMERFVRGDLSRSTEGSGLGLSIAKSLTELQDGTMELSIDGDLFKATLKFRTVRSSGEG